MHLLGMIKPAFWQNLFTLGLEFCKPIIAFYVGKNLAVTILKYLSRKNDFDLMQIISLIGDNLPIISNPVSWDK